MPTPLVFPSPAATAAVVGAAYLIGSVPFGYIVARAKGVDIRRIGSGNIGATNVARACGRLAGRIVLALDIAKGFVPAAFVAPLMVAWLDPAAGAQALAASRAAAALAAIVGHNWPVWLLFRGGKGVAVTIGAFGALLGYWMLAPLVVWGLAAHVTGYVSVGSIALGAATAVAAIALWAAGRADASTAAAGVLAALLIVLRHRANIARLSAGAEPKRGAETPPPSGGPTAPGRDGGER
jgi:glycerol-3-phosphate acyltransferase PlsY